MLLPLRRLLRSGRAAMHPWRNPRLPAWPCAVRLGLLRGRRGVHPSGMQPARTRLPGAPLRTRRGVHAPGLLPVRPGHACGLLSGRQGCLRRQVLPARRELPDHTRRHFLLPPGSLLRVGSVPAGNPLRCRQDLLSGRLTSVGSYRQPGRDASGRIKGRRRPRHRCHTGKERES